MTITEALASWGSYDLDDPFPVFAEVRRLGPVHAVTLADGHEAWLVAGYEEALAALNDPRLSKDMHAALATGSGVVAEGLPGPAFARHMLTVDPPDHTRLRRLVSAAFSPRRVEALRAHVQTIADDLLDAVAAQGPDSRVDLVRAFAFPLPYTVICELLGVPSPDRAPLGQGFTKLLVPTSTPAAYAAAKEASDAVVGMLRALVEAKQKDPGDDLVSGLISARDGDERLDNQELLSTIFQLIVAGHDTTASLIGNSVVALFRNPVQLTELRADPTKIPKAIEEFLRYDAPVPHSTFRYTTEPVHLGGVAIPAGAQVIICLAAANRDAGRYTRPERLDLDRDEARHLAFGHGIHHCLGAPLARIEGQLALATLLSRFPELALAVPIRRIALGARGRPRAAGPLGVAGRPRPRHREGATVTAERAVPTGPDDGWRGVDEGWGRQAVAFATICEPTNCREYVALHNYLGVHPGDRLLDVACGAGLALELAGVRGARCAGIDASSRLIAIARDRNPDADVRVGDMHALPWEDDAFTVVTSFRGIWGTTPGAVGEVHRVLAPGGRVGLTVWGHIKASPGAWALAPFALASTPKVEHQASMVALGRPGAGEAFLQDAGFVDIERIDIPFVFEFADPDVFARAIASTGPAFEAMEAVGETAFLEAAVELAREKVRDGLPLRAPISVVGYIASKPIRPSASSGDHPVTHGSESSGGFLARPMHTPEAQHLFDDDLKGGGYVTNVSRLWAFMPGTLEGLSDLMSQTTQAGSLTFRQRAVLVTAAASTLGDSYCSLAWGKKLAAEVGSDVAASVILGDDEGLDPADKVLAKWARRVATDPNAVVADDVHALRDGGFDDAQIFAITTFLALRLAFSTVNDALGACPDRELDASTPEAVRSAITFGRQPGPDDA